MALDLVRGVPLTPKEKETMLEVLTPPPAPRRRMVGFIMTEDSFASPHLYLGFFVSIFPIEVLTNTIPTVKKLLVALNN